MGDVVSRFSRKGTSRKLFVVLQRELCAGTRLHGVGSDSERGNDIEGLAKT